MPHTHCPNGHAVAADDTGETYCPVCGVLCPTTDAAPPTRRVSVFTADGADRVADAAAGETACPRCHAAVAYTVAEYGGSAYCPKCGAGVPVGQTLERVAADRAAARPEPTAATPPRSPRRRPSRYRAAVLLGGLAAAGFYVSWRHPDALPFDAAVLPWSRPVIDTGGAPPDGPHGPSSSAAVPVRPDEHITLDRIEHLARRPDVGEALLDARAWHDTLAGCAVPKSDPRWAALDRVIPELRKNQQALRKPVGPPRPVAEFVERLSQLRLALARADRDAARRAASAAAKLLDAHPAELAAYRDAYQAEADRLAHLDRRAAGAKRVEELLAEAAAHAGANKPTEALECRARAVFLAGHYSPKADAARLAATLREVDAAVSRARARRAAADARKCRTDGDAAALARVVAEVRELAQWFDAGLAADFQAAVKAGEEKMGMKSGGEFGKGVLFRYDYEAVLAALGDGKPAAVVAAAARCRPAPTDADRRRLADLVFEALRTEVAEVVALPAGSAGLDRRLTDSRTALDAAGPWQADPRWADLDAALRRRAGR